MKKILGLCEGRHTIEKVEGYIFGKELNIRDLGYMRMLAHEVLYETKELDLYVTGLTVALVTVINYCLYNHIALTLYHYDREYDNYYPQEVNPVT